MAAAPIKLLCRFCVLFVVLLTTSLKANPVSLPFFESFNTQTNDAISTYPNFTFDDGGSGITPSLVVNANNVLQVGSGGFPYYPAFGVTPDPFPTGELVIKCDMGWDGRINDPPVGAGFGGAGLRFGTKIETSGATGSLNVMGFHPGYPSSPIRVEGPGGFPNTNMGWTAALGVLNHVEIHSFPNGLFNIKIVDGTNPANVFTTSFTSPGAYGGEIAFIAFAGGSGLYDNLSISVAGAPLYGDYNNDGFVNAADYSLWRKNVGQPAGTLPNDNTGLPIGVDQYTLWRSNFGVPGAGSGSLLSSSVPEPSSLLILLMGTAAAAVARRRSHSLVYAMKFVAPSAPAQLGREAK